MKQPLISIIIPTYNRAHLISETLDSILVQTYTNWECIVVDDGSTDNTQEIINSYIKKDCRFQYFQRSAKSLKGASSCRNIGFEKSKGNYIQYLDSDDLISENKLNEQITVLSEASDYSIATCKWGRFSETNKDKVVFENLESYATFDSIEFFLTALANSKGYFPIHSYLIKRKLIEKTGGWNEYLSLNDDGEFMMRLITNVEKVFFSSEAYVYYRFGNGANASSLYQEQKAADMIDSFRMIDYLFKIRFKVKTVYYIEKIKEDLYHNIINKFPHLICENDVFFAKQLNARPLIVKLKSRLKRYLYGK
jgi:glycosyltransferase involved in cell wall biosynthesis